MAFKTPRLSGIPLGIRVSPFGFLVPSFLLQLYFGSSTLSPSLLVHGFPCLNDAEETSRFLNWSSGFSPPLRYRASSVPIYQYYPWICHPLTPNRFRVSLSVRFSGLSRSIRGQVRRASLGKTQHLPISRPTSLRFGPPDIRSRSLTPARPPPRCHIVGSLFATYMGSASCFLRTVRFRHCPCPVGVALPSGNGGQFYFRQRVPEERRLHHARRT
jgi:hypothetical protein